MIFSKRIDGWVIFSFTGHILWNAVPKNSKGGKSLLMEVVFYVFKIGSDVF